MSEDANNGKSRLFIRDVENKAWQLFSLSQSKKEGDIYLGSPDFKGFEWLTFEMKEDELMPFKVQQDKDGHVSFHAHGQAHVKVEGEEYKLPIPGQHLLKLEEKEISARHLFTLFPKKPEIMPFTEALGRKGDQIIQSSETIRPFVMVAFALPRMGFNLEFGMSFDIDDLENVPGGMLGSHLFPLFHHDIFIFLYRTKNMDEWPKRSMLQYSDGIWVPLFFGEPEKMIRVQCRRPEFSIVGKALKVTI